MRARYKTKAIIGITLWVAMVAMTIFLLVSARNPKLTDAEVSRRMTFLGWWMLAHFFCFFWAAYQLARAKGYSEALLLFGLLCIPGQLVLLVVLLVLPDQHSKRQGIARSPWKTRESPSSPLERRTRYRRNALLGNVLGLCGISLAIYLVLFPMGLARDPDDEIVVALLIFLGGYCGLISGCWYWLKAKQWNEEVVLIGLAPVVILFIPYVRLIFLAVAWLLPLAMLVMPILLLVVVMALPDYSGPLKSTGSWGISRRRKRRSSLTE